MFTGVTYQDWVQLGGNKVDSLPGIVNRYRMSSDFKNALVASAYFRGDNIKVNNKTIIRADATTVGVKTTVDGREITKRRKKLIARDVIGNRVATAFFFRFVLQENQHLLSNGVTLADAETKALLGIGFDKALEQIGEYALQHGVCWGFWNKDHLECIPAATDGASGAFSLLDEVTGAPMVFIQFWRIADNKPMTIRVFETDGLTVYTEGADGQLHMVQEKTPYIVQTTTDELGVIRRDGYNYHTLPVVPLYANNEKRSEFTNSIKEKIDLYDAIMSDFGDNLERANDVYWVLNNFGGTMEDMAEMVQQMERLHVVSNKADGTGANSTAEPHTLEVPYQARESALKLLKKALYQDYMAMDMDDLTGGSLTNVAIKVATTSLNMKVDRYEWQVFNFVQAILRLVGVETERISFTRQSIANEQETVDTIYKMREDIDRETALKLNPYIMQEEIPTILQNVALEEVSGLTSAQELNRQLELEG